MATPLPPTTLIFSPSGRRPMVLPLASGQVVVIADASGLMSSGWENELLTRKEGGSVRLSQDGAPISPNDLQFVGFDDQLPEIPVKEFLATFCNDVEGIIREFELSEVASLQCAYLPPAASRQLCLLKAFSKERSIIVLNDPFLPFNGRWRESFAGFVVEQASIGASIVICCNVGFIPKTWTTLPTVKVQDIAGLLPMAPEARAAAAISSMPEPASKRQVNENNAQYYAPGIPIPIPNSAIRVYKEVKDWVFDPLARACKFLGTWSGALTGLGLALVLGTMGVMFVPNLAQSHEILRALAKRFNYTWPESPKEVTSTQNTSEEREKTPAALAQSEDPKPAQTDDTHVGLTEYEPLYNGAPLSDSSLAKLSFDPYFTIPGRFTPPWMEATEMQGSASERYLAALGLPLGESDTLVCAPEDECVVVQSPPSLRKLPEITTVYPQQSLSNETQVTSESATEPEVAPQ